MAVYKHICYIYLNDRPGEDKPRRPLSDGHLRLKERAPRKGTAQHRAGNACKESARTERQIVSRHSIVTAMCLTVLAPASSAQAPGGACGE